MDFINILYILCKFTPRPAVLPGSCCFEELLDGGDGDGDGDGDDDDHGDDVHVCGDGDQYHGCHEEDGKSDGGGGCGDGPFCDDDHHAHDVNA